MAGFGFKPLKAGGGSGYAIVSKKGKPHWLKLGRYNTLGDAKRAHKRWEREGHETMQSFPCTSDSPTLAQYTPRYLERTIGKNLTGEGIDRARSSLKHLNRLLGHMKLHRIDPNAVEDYIIKRKNELNPRNGLCPEDHQHRSDPTVLRHRGSRNERHHLYTPFQDPTETFEKLFPQNH